MRQQRGADRYEEKRLSGFGGCQVSLRVDAPSIVVPTTVDWGLRIRGWSRIGQSADQSVRKRKKECCDTGTKLQRHLHVI